RPRQRDRVSPPPPAPPGACANRERARPRRTARPTRQATLTAHRASNRAARRATREGRITAPGGDPDRAPETTDRPDTYPVSHVPDSGRGHPDAAPVKPVRDLGTRVACRS